MHQYVKYRAHLECMTDYMQTQTDNPPSIDPPPPVDPNLPPPPPPEPVRSDSDSSDDDDGHHPWHPIQEDHSTPDEAELKEIEEGVEVSALDHEHWEKQAFEALTDPEHSAGVSGRIEWAIQNYHGTRENPNKELVMKSEPVTIGGYEWQIKFYPRGNDSDYLSVYVECLSVQDKVSPPPESAPEVQGEAKEVDEMATEPASNTVPPENMEPQHAPLPLLDDVSIPKRRSVAAQVAVVLYNPKEPRVNYFKTCLHRFCSKSPDWGWTRFHGPYYDIAHRVRGQRQALLRDDKLAFTAYIKLVEDETGCLWEHSSRDNPWDSFAMTGLQGLTLGADRVRERVPSGGNLISAIASWMLFKPFRQLLYTYKVPENELLRPKPLLTALQAVLFMLRTRVKPGSGPVSLRVVISALEWYGIYEQLNKLDVIETWEVLRLKLEEELADTPFANVPEEMFGRKRDYSSGVPSYRVPVLGVSTMQAAVDNAHNFLHPSQPLPQFLTVEMQRQEFDLATRSYVKLLNKVALDEHINVRNTQYSLFGFIVHKQTLQSYIYHPVLRPEGPSSKWYLYTDGKEENLVKCLTKRQAIDDHEGKAGSGKVTGNDPVAYIALYVRADIARTTLKTQADPEPWDVQEWLRHEFSDSHKSSVPASPPPEARDAIARSSEQSPVTDIKESSPVPRKFHVIDSKAFLQHEGPGIIDIYDPQWQPGHSDLVYTIQVDDITSRDIVREKIAAVVPGIKDPRQITFWVLLPEEGGLARPLFLELGEISLLSDDSTSPGFPDPLPATPASHLWMHVADFESLPKLPKEGPATVEPAPVAHAEISASTTAIDASVHPTPAPTDAQSTQAPSAGPVDPQSPAPPTTEPQSEDTPMSEPDEPIPPPPEIVSPEVQVTEIQTEDAPPPAPTGSDERTDTTMAEVDVEVAIEPFSFADPPAVDVVVSTSAATADTEMSGAQESLPPPPPVFAAPESQITTPPPPPLQEVPVPEIQPPPDVVHFFLKFFDAECQTLQSRGFHASLRSAKLDSTVLSALNLPSEQKIELVVENPDHTTRALRTRRSFHSNDLYNASIIIASVPLSEEKCNALAAQGAFSNVQSFLEYRILARNFPERMTGHFTYDSFSSQYYKGEMKNGHRHGHGTRIYHSGAKYEGTFRLGQRHGHGLYTFENGDTYDGDWVADQQHGSGTFVEASTGNTYVGGWKNDKKFGEGVTHWKNAQEPERLCRICYEDNADAALYDCGHVVACLPCARQVQSCPVCRKRVLSAMKLYYVA